MLAGVFLLSVSVLIVLLSIVSRSPSVTSVEPRKFTTGSRLTITGDNFGDQTGAVIISAQRIGTNRILDWADNTIVIEVPADTRSGLLYVQTNRGSSDGFLLTNRDEIPTPSTERPPNQPTVASVSAQLPRVGGLVIITGDRFGARRHDSFVTFSASWSGLSDVRPEPGVIGYPQWTQNQIIVRIPDGAAGGPVHLVVGDRRVPIGELEITPPAKRYLSAREFVVRRRVAYDGVVAAEADPDAPPGARSVVVWMPIIGAFPEQGELRHIVAPPQPMLSIESAPIAVYRESMLTDGSEGEFAEVVAVKRRAVALDPAQLDPASWTVRDEPFIEYYTRSTSHLPADSPAFVAVANEHADASPVNTARRLYEWLLTHLQYRPYLAERSASFGLETRYGDDYTYATLMVALLRAAGIPARPVSGMLITQTGDSYVHFWCEMMILGEGWIPIDPSLGDGNFPGSFPVPDDPRIYYFGSLDPYRLTVQKGEFETDGIDADARRWVPADPDSLQSVFAEISRGIAEISLHWDGISVLGSY